MAIHCVAELEALVPGEVEIREVRESYPVMRTFVFLLLLLPVLLSAQRRQIPNDTHQNFTVVTFDGDSFVCKELIIKGKTVICKTEGEKKLKFECTEIKYYVQAYSKLLRDELPPPFVDTTQKFFLDSAGRIHEVLIENDSFYLSAVDTLFKDKPHVEYYINYKHNNQQVQKIKQDRYALDPLVKYFGGHCAEFDKSVAAAQPVFKKKGFVVNDYWNLLWNYHRQCSS